MWRNAVALFFWVMFVFCGPVASTSFAQSILAPEPRQLESSAKLAVTWAPPWEVSKQRPGYPLLKNVASFEVQPADIKFGVYKHHPQIVHFEGKLLAAWSSHRWGEDGPGQYVSFSISNDGSQWGPSSVLFPALGAVKKSKLLGNVLTANGFVRTKRSLYAIAEAHENVGFTDAASSITSPPKSPIRTKQFGKRCRRGIGRLVRKIEADGTLGLAFWLEDPRQPREHMPVFSVANPVAVPDLGELKLQLQKPEQLLTWDFSGNTTEATAADGTRLVEPTTYLSPAGTWIRLWRAQNRAHCLYMQASRNGDEWSVAEPTDVPDAPSKTTTLRLASGQVVLIGNQVFNKRGTRRDPLTIAIAKDGLNFDAAYSIRWRTPNFRIPAVPGDGRGTGFQYPSVVQVGESLWVVYSVNKESIEVSEVALRELEKTAKDR